MDDYMVGLGRRRRMARALIAAGVLLGLALPWHAAAQIPTPVGEIPIPTTLPPVLGGGDGDGGGGGGIVTPPPVTTPTTVPPAPTPSTTVATVPDEQPRTEPTTARARARTSTGRPAVGAPAAGDDAVVQRAAAEAANRRAIARLREASVPAARQFGFPLVMGAFVLAFLVVQGRLDARDPKLAAAPVTVDDDLLPFL